MFSLRSHSSIARERVAASGLYIMQKGDIPSLVDCASIFYSPGYPLFKWVFGEKCNEDMVRSYWTITLKSLYKSGAVIYADSPECNACAVWQPQFFNAAMPLRFIRMVYGCGAASALRMVKYELYCQKICRSVTRGKGWHLRCLAVPYDARQRHGITHMLLDPMLEYARSEGRPVYVDTSSEQSYDIYDSLGFKLASDTCIPYTNLLHWGMIQ